MENKSFIKTVANPGFKENLSVKGCGECGASCQSACKTSCTVASQKCRNTAVKKI